MTELSDTIGDKEALQRVTSTCKEAIRIIFIHQTYHL